MKTALILVPTTNTDGKKDVTGAFAPEAERYAEVQRRAGFNVVLSRIDNTKPIPNRKVQALAAIRSAIPTDGGALDRVTFLCHGWRDGVQVGFTRKTISELVALPLPQNVLFTLYCCSTAEDAKNASIEAPGVGDGSFADTLRDALCAAGKTQCRVMGHTTVAHTTRNPNAVFFDGMGSPVGGVGGIAPVPPGHQLWRAWKAALQSETDFRFRFPDMTVAEIHAELLTMR